MSKELDLEDDLRDVAYPYDDNNLKYRLSQAYDLSVIPHTQITGYAELYFRQLAPIWQEFSCNIGAKDLRKLAKDLLEAADYLENEIRGK